MAGAPSAGVRGANRLVAAGRSLRPAAAAAAVPDALGRMAPGGMGAVNAGAAGDCDGVTAADGITGGKTGGTKGGTLGLKLGLKLGLPVGLAAPGLARVAMGPILAGLRAGSSRVTPSGAWSEVASMTPVLEMDLSSKSSATALPTR